MAPGSDICSLIVSPSWEPLGTRCGSGRVLDLPSRQPGGGRTPGPTHLQGLRVELKIAKDQTERCFHSNGKNSRCGLFPAEGEAKVSVPPEISFKEAERPAQRRPVQVHLTCALLVSSSCPTAILETASKRGVHQQKSHGAGAGSSSL